MVRGSGFRQLDAMSHSAVGYQSAGQIKSDRIQHIKISLLLHRPLHAQTPPIVLLLLLVSRHGGHGLEIGSVQGLGRGDVERTW